MAWLLPQQGKLKGVLGVGRGWRERGNRRGRKRERDGERGKRTGEEKG